MATTQTERKQFVRDFVQDVFVEGNLDRIEEYIAPDFVGHNSAWPEEIHGPEEYRAFTTTLGNAFPDMTVTIEDLICEGNKVVQRSTQTATHEGELFGIEPTGKTIEESGIVIYEIEDGKIVGESTQTDMMGIMEQLGLMDTETDQ